MHVENDANETAVDETAVDETAVDETTGAGSENSVTKADEESASNEFNAAEFEQTFGLPSGSLKDAQDAETAINIIREHTDRSLIAGLDAVSQAPAPTTTDEADKSKTKASGNAEIDALRAELSEVKTMLARQNENQETQFMQELDRRIEAEIDSWASPKFGTKQSRTFKQTKAAREIRNLVLEHAVTLQRLGEPVPVVEALTRRLRLIEDDNYKPAKSTAKQQPLGTPGKTSKGSKGDSIPRNIHEALIGNRS